MCTLKTSADKRKSNFVFVQMHFVKAVGSHEWHIKNTFGIRIKTHEPVCVYTGVSER